MGGPEGTEGIEPEWAERLRVWGSSEPEVLAIWIFGSRARGSGRDDSDLDIGIQTDGELPSEAAGDWMAMKARVRAAIAELIPEVSTDVHGAIPGWSTERVWPGIERDGLKVYERGA